MWYFCHIFLVSIRLGGTVPNRGATHGSFSIIDCTDQHKLFFCPPTLKDTRAEQRFFLARTFEPNTLFLTAAPVWVGTTLDKHQIFPKRSILVVQNGRQQKYKYESYIATMLCVGVGICTAMITYNTQASP